MPFPFNAILIAYGEMDSATHPASASFAAHLDLNQKHDGASRLPRRWRDGHAKSTRGNVRFGKAAMQQRATPRMTAKGRKGLRVENDAPHRRKSAMEPNAAIAICWFPRNLIGDQQLENLKGRFGESSPRRHLRAPL